MVSSGHKKIFSILPYLVITLMAVPFLVRAFFGFDWSDECYYLALPYRLALGDHLLVDSWDVHQTSAILIAPILWLYRCIMGNMDGIILFMRLLFVTFQFMVALIVYRVIYNLYTNRIIGLLTSAICFSFVPFSISNFSYNTMGYMLIIVTGMLLISLYLGESIQKLTVLSGLASVTYSCACLAYPYYVLVLPSFIFLLCAVKPSAKKQDGSHKTIFTLILFLTGCVFCFIIVCAYLLITVGFAGIQNNIRFLFDDPESSSMNFPVRILLLIKDYYHLLFWAMLQIILLISIIISKYLKINIENNIIFTISIKLLIPFCIIANSIIILCDQAIPVTTKINQLQICVGLWPLIIFTIKPTKKQAIIMFTMYIPANLMYLGVYLASNNGIAGAPYALIVGVMSACPIIYEYYEPMVQNLKQSHRRSLALLLQVGLIGIVVFIGIINSVLRLETVYRDLPVPQLTVQMTIGPAKGIFTTLADAANYEGIVTDIIASVPSNGRVLFAGLLPFAYLCTNQKPAPPSLWRTPLSDERLKVYFVQNPANRPTFIYVVKKQYGRTNENNEPDIVIARRVAGNKVSKKETKYSYQYIISE